MSSSLSSTTLNTNTVNATTVNASRFIGSVRYLDVDYVPYSDYYLPDYGIGVLVIARIYFDYHEGAVYPKIYLPDTQYSKYLVFAVNYDYNGLESILPNANFPLKDRSSPPTGFENTFKKWAPIYIYNPLQVPGDSVLPSSETPLFYINDPITIIYMKVTDSNN